jgi:HlyD family secretion protein
VPHRNAIPALVLLSCLAAACGKGGDAPATANAENRKDDWAVPVVVTLPTTGTVEDHVETQAHLESDRRVDIFAEVDGRVVARLKDVGDRVGEPEDGADPFVLARIDDRDLALALKEAEIQLKDKRGRIQELELERKRAGRELEQARVALDEADAVLRRTQSGLEEDIISAEENERAVFAQKAAASKLATAVAANEKSAVALMLGDVAVEQAQAVRDRATLALAKTVIVAPLAGTVTLCNVREGERVRVGDLLYRVEAPGALVAYADIPVRQANRIRVQNRVVVRSNATAGDTTGVVELVAPTVDRDSGTVRVKVSVEPAPGFKPGLFLTLRIVVEQREAALVVPKRAVLHHDEEGAYLFVVRDDKAERRLVETGFERDEMIEIVSGIEATDRVVIEGQDTLTPASRVEIREGA